MLVKILDHVARGSDAGAFDPAVCRLMDFLYIVMNFKAVLTEARNHQFQAVRGRSADCQVISRCSDNSVFAKFHRLHQDQTRRQCNLRCFVTSGQISQIFNPCPANSSKEPSDFVCIGLWTLPAHATRGRVTFGVVVCRVCGNVLLRTPNVPCGSTFGPVSIFHT